MKKLLIIGAGGWGLTHVNNAIRHPDWEIAGCVDISPSVHKRLQKKFHIPKDILFTDYREALKKVKADAATVTVPNPHRMPVLKKLLELNLDLLIDKPVVHTPSDLRKLIQWQNKAKSIVMVAQNYRFDLLTRELKKRIQKRKFGKINHITGTFLRDCSGFTNPNYLKMIGNKLLVVEMCIHHFDLLRFFLKSNPLTISAHSWRHSKSWGKGDTGLHVLMEFPDNIHITYYADWARPFHETTWGGKWEFSFDQGVLHWEHGSNSPALWKSKTNGNSFIQNEIHLSQNPSKDWSPPSSMYPTFEEFTRAIFQRKQPECNLQDNLYSIAISFAVQESCNTGKIIDFNKFLKFNKLI